MTKYLGIKYAEAERFGIPKLLEFSGTADPSASHGPHHFQMGFGPGVGEVPGGSDDCLHLDVWLPDNCDEAKPVLVWIYGGGFEGGMTKSFDAGLLANEQDVVVVVVNYRVGFLGFGYLPGELETNLGLRDVIRSVQWVQKNIGIFGGDSQNITLLGESAGGFLATAAVASKELKCFDFKLIAMSGAASRLVMVEDIERLTRDWLSKLGVRKISETDQFTSSELLSAQTAVIPRDFGQRNGARVNALGVILDSSLDNGVLEAHPFQSLSNSISKVFLTTVEREMQTMRTYAPEAFESATENSLVAEIASFANSIDKGREITSKYLSRYESPAMSREQILSDFIYRLPAARLAKVRKLKTWSLDFAPELASGRGKDVTLLFPKDSERVVQGREFRNQVGQYAHSDTPGNIQEVDFDWLLDTWQGIERI